MSKILIRYNRPNVHHIGGVRLMPGINEVDAEAFEKWSRLKAFAALLEKQKGETQATIELVEKGAPKKPADDGDEDAQPDVDLSKLSAKEAISLVEETLTVDLLKKWSTTETRATVKKALEEQLILAGPTALKKPAEDGDEDEK